MTRRFVVQRHEVQAADGPQVHFDLMIEDGAALVTFQLATPPAEGAPARGRRSFDHRPRYLDYEGPLAHERGAVRIWDRGQVDDLEGDPRAPAYRARVRGERLAGTLDVRETRAAPPGAPRQVGSRAPGAEVEVTLG